MLKTVSPCYGYIERTQGKTGETGKGGLSCGTLKLDARQKEESFFKPAVIFLQQCLDGQRKKENLKSWFDGFNFHCS